MPKKLTKPDTPLSRVEALLSEYERLDARAETEIESYVDSIHIPGAMPKAIARQCTIDTRAAGYSFPRALQVVRDRLVNP